MFSSSFLFLSQLGPYFKNLLQLGSFVSTSRVNYVSRVSM